MNEIEQSAAAQQQQRRHQDVYNLDELNDGMSLPKSAAAAAAQQTVPEEEKQVVDYGDQFDYRGGAAGAGKGANP